MRRAAAERDLPVGVTCRQRCGGSEPSGLVAKVVATSKTGRNAAENDPQEESRGINSGAPWTLEAARSCVEPRQSIGMAARGAPRSARVSVFGFRTSALATAQPSLTRQSLVGRGSHHRSDKLTTDELTTLIKFHDWQIAHDINSQHSRKGERLGLCRWILGQGFKYHRGAQFCPSGTVGIL
eukprot:g365.t1